VIRDTAKRAQDGNPSGSRRSERGSAAVELALVLPVAILILAGIIQFGVLLFVQNSMTSVANDIVRRVAVRAASADEAETQAVNRLSDWSASFVASVTEPTAEEVKIRITVPITDVLFVDFGDLFGSGELVAEATMRKE